jgi:hypothetical protein
MPPSLLSGTLVKLKNTSPSSLSTTHPPEKLFYQTFSENSFSSIGEASHGTEAKKKKTFTSETKIVVSVHLCHCLGIKRQLAHHNLVRFIKFSGKVLCFWLPRTLGIIFAKRRDFLVGTKLSGCYWCFWFGVIID